MQSSRTSLTRNNPLSGKQVACPKSRGKSSETRGIASNKIMNIEFQDDFELDEDDISSVFFYATCDGAPVQIRADAGALLKTAPDNFYEDTSDQFLDSRKRFEDIAIELIQQGRVQNGYLEIKGEDVH